MGVYIKGMSKPKSCKECESFYIEFYMGENKMGSACTLNDDDGSTIEADYNSCPLIEIDLVRCGECKWWDRDGKRKDGKGWCENVICGLTKLNAFCSYGERRADEHNTERD